MDQTARPILYSFRRCPYAMRARLGLLFGERPVELREVILRDKPQALRDASPKATVPILVLENGEVIEESFDIMLWALGLRDPRRLMVPEIGAQAEMMALISRIDGPFKHHLDRYKYPNKFEQDDPPVDHRAAAMEIVSELDALLQNQPFLLGNKIGLADIATAPFVRQFAHVDRVWFEAHAPDHAQYWLNAFKESDYFAAIMAKYPQWQEGEAGIDFCPSLPSG